MQKMQVGNKKNVSKCYHENSKHLNNLFKKLVPLKTEAKSVKNYQPRNTVAGSQLGHSSWIAVVKVNVNNFYSEHVIVWGLTSWSFEGSAHAHSLESSVFLDKLLLVISP